MRAAVTVPDIRGPGGGLLFGRGGGEHGAWFPGVIAGDPDAVGQFTAGAKAHWYVPHHKNVPDARDHGAKDATAQHPRAVEVRVPSGIGQDPEGVLRRASMRRDTATTASPVVLVMRASVNRRA